MSPASLTTSNLILYAIVFVLAFWGLFLALYAHAQWHADWPLADTGVVKTVYFTNLLEAIHERQDAVGHARVDVLLTNVTVDGTNTEVVTNIFGTREVVSTNYTETFATNVTTNVFGTFPDYEMLRQLDVALWQILRDPQELWMAPWQTNAAGDLGGWFSLTNDSGDFTTDRPQIAGSDLNEFVWAAAYLGWPISHGGTAVTTDDYGRVSGGGAHMPRSPGTYDRNTNEVLLAQANYHDHDTHGKRWTAIATNESGVLITRLEFPFELALGPMQHPPDTPELRYTYGGTDTISGSITMQVTGETFYAIGETEDVTLTNAGTYPLTGYWSRIRDITQESGTVPNVATNQTNLYGGDLVEVYYPTGTLFATMQLDSISWQPETARADRYITTAELNYRREIINLLYIVGTRGIQPDNNEYSLTWDLSSTNKREGVSNHTTWATAKAGAEHAFTTNALGNDTEPEQASYGRLVAGVYDDTHLLSIWNKLDITVPASVTNYEFVLALYFDGSPPSRGGDMLFDNNGYSVSNHTAVWTNFGVTNATNYSVTVGDSSLTVKPNWVGTPGGTTYTSRGWRVENPFITLNFGHTTNGFQYVSPDAYTNKW